MDDEKQGWQELGQQLRVDAVWVSGVAGSGHPTSSMSAADLMAVLISKYLHYDFNDPENPANDHLIFSKGHASPLLYAIYKAVGAVTGEEMATYRQLGSRLEGHPTPDLPWVDVATGSLGQGLPIAVGVAMAAKKLDRLDYRTWVLCGDSEMAEGSIWEAFEEASFAGLDNITVIIDVNRLGQSGPTRHSWDLDAYRNRAEAFGWHAIELDGHDVEAIDAAFAEAVATTGKPTVLIAKTKKGKGVPWVEDQLNAHGKAVDRWEEAIEVLGGDRHLRVDVPKPPAGVTPHTFQTSGALELPSYEKGDKVATRKAYGEALAALGNARGDVVALDGEVSNSTFSEIFRNAHPDRYFECYIAEQQMIATAVGFQVRHWVPFASTFAAFLSRAYDFIRMGAVSQARMNICGSHAGVSIGEDGPSQMGLEDLAMFRAIHNSTVLYPSDGVQTAHLVNLMADLPEGIAYLRTTRGNTEVLYGPDETFEVGGSKVLRSSDDDKVTIVAAGITLHESLKAADALAADGIAVRVIDLYSVKPLDTATLTEAARATGGRVLTVEDHWPEGGIGDAVAAALAEAQLDVPVKLVKLAVSRMPGSAKPDECITAAGIDAESIAGAASKLAG
ncbi:MAG TPA: transketolase [Acidimicrobiales bacterium]|nr:transketolase [Acidimicrobiales bacterium]